MNSVQLLGRLTKDPELRYVGSKNTANATFTLAVNRRFKQEGQPEADFINCVAWSKTAEFVGKYFQKGQQVAVVGRLQTRTWDDNEGKRHYVTEVVADEAYFADSKREGQQQPKPQNDGVGELEDRLAGTDGFCPMDEDELPFNGGLDFPR